MSSTQHHQQGTVETIDVFIVHLSPHGQDSSTVSKRRMSTFSGETDPAGALFSQCASLEKSSSVQEAVVL